MAAGGFAQPVYSQIDGPYHAGLNSIVWGNQCKYLIVCITLFDLVLTVCLWSSSSSACQPLVYFSCCASYCSTHTPPASYCTVTLGNWQLYTGHILFWWIQNEGSGLFLLQITSRIQIDLNLHKESPVTRSSKCTCHEHVFCFQVIDSDWGDYGGLCCLQQWQKHCYKFNRMAQWPLDKLINHQKRQFDTAAGRVARSDCNCKNPVSFSCLEFSCLSTGKV